MIKTPLVSVIILSYNSSDTISRAVHSVLVQDYPYIELLIADDGSQDFSYQFVESLFVGVEAREGFSYRIVNNSVNSGTVANLWSALDVMSGDCFMVIGADDALASPSVISNYIDFFNLRSWEPLAVVSRAEMRSEDLNEFYSNLPDDEGRLVLVSEDSNQLYSALASKCIIPIVATCFQKSFIEAVQAFSKDYKYYEDYPTFLRMARLGIAPAYLDEVSTLHASGGIANGKQSDALRKALYRDRSLMWKREFDPYSNRVSSEVRKKNKERRELERNLLHAGDSDDSARFLSASEVLEQLGVFFHRRLFQRAIGSWIFFALLVLITACLFTLHGGWGVLALVSAFVSALLLLVSLWFTGSYIVRFIKRRFS